jgi:hypothetical protein
MNIIIDREAIDARVAHGQLWMKGWGTPNNPAQPTCLHGAIRYCTPQPGDAHIIEQVGAKFGWGTNDNDNANSWESLFALVPTEITDSMLEATFGTQWKQIVALVRRAATLTDNEGRQLQVKQDAAWGAAWRAAQDAAADAAADAARAAAGIAAQNAAWAAVQDAEWYPARDAARNVAQDTVSALTVRDLIGQYGFTQDHYNLLTGPWQTVIGPVHPDDGDL